MVFGMNQIQAWPLVEPIVRQTVDAAGVTVVVRNSYFAFGRELTRLFRTLAGNTLVCSIRRLFLKWKMFGLDPAILQQLFLACFDQLFRLPPSAVPLPQPLLSTNRRTKIKSRKHQPGRRHRTYAQALARGKGTRARSGTAQEQVARHRAGAKRQRQVSATTRAVLTGFGVPMRLFVRYNAVALKLDRLVRLRTAKTLERLALDLIERYAAEGLDERVLLALYRRIAGIEPPADASY